MKRRALLADGTTKEYNYTYHEIAGEDALEYHRRKAKERRDRHRKNASAPLRSFKHQPNVPLEQRVGQDVIDAVCKERAAHQTSYLALASKYGVSTRTIRRILQVL